MSKTTAGRYVALVIVTCYVDGVRTDLQPGEDLPDTITEHDIEQLKRLGAIEDKVETANAVKAEAKEQKAGDAEFQEARASVQAAVASASADVPETAAAPAAPAAPAAKTAKKKD